MSEKLKNPFSEDSEARQLIDRALVTVDPEEQHDRVSEAFGILEKAAYHDPITGLYNRLGFDTLLGSTCETSSEPIGLVVVDLDNFKAVNDYGGHPKGDEFLHRIGNAIAKCVRTEKKQPEDQVDLVGHDGNRAFTARIGGDEFMIGIVLSPRESLTGHDDEGQSGAENTDQVPLPDDDKMKIVIDRINGVVNSTVIEFLAKNPDLAKILNDQKIKIGASVGYSIIDQDRVLATAYELADKSLHESKQNRTAYRELAIVKAVAAGIRAQRSKSRHRRNIKR